MKEKKNNIFDPRFGKRPAYFIGREDILRDIRAMMDDPDEENKTAIISGIKGSGKTAILSEIKSGLEQPHVVTIIDDAEKTTEALRALLTGFSQDVGGGKLINEARNRGLIIAGLPHAIEEILKDEEFSLLRHSYRVALTGIRAEEVFYLFEDTFPDSESDVLKRAAEATMGYPYLIQLIGYYLSKEEKGIDDKAADRAIFRSKIEMYKNIHEPLVWSLSSKDRMFLWSMAQDEGASEFGEIAKRMDVSAGYASKYRERLIGANVIYSSAYGELAFTLPFMKEYIEKEYVERLGGEGGKRRL